jgi:hypothetical protein
MYYKIYENCNPAPKEIICKCGKVLIKMSNGKPRRVLECCCVDCYQHNEWASVMGGPNVPVIPTLSYWDNDIVVIRGEEHLKVVLLREDGRSKRTTATCCFSTLMVDHPYYSGVMFMLFEDACRVQQDEPDVSPTKTRPAESRIYLKDFDTSRGTLPEFRGDPTRVHQTCCPEYIKGWNRKSSPTLDNPSGEKIQALFERIPEMILGLDQGKRINNLKDCSPGYI